MKKGEKIVGSDKVAQATGYYTSRRALTRALNNPECDNLLSIYGGSPDDPMFWLETKHGDQVAWSEANDEQRSSRKWKLCTRPEDAAAFGQFMRYFNECVRPTVNNYLESSRNRRKKMIAKNQFLPIEVLRREIGEDLRAGRIYPDWDQEQQPFDDQFLMENCDVPEIAKEIIKRKLANGRPRTFEFISNIVDGFTVRAIREMLVEVGAVQVDGDVERWKLDKKG